MSKEHRKYIVCGSVAAVMIALDQWTKALVRDAFDVVGSAEKSLIGDAVTLHHFENTGMAFGLLRDFPGARPFLTAVPILAFVLVFFYLRRTSNEDLRTHVALGLVGGGAGNLIDRVRYGSVTDFMLVDLGFWPLHPWPAFNLADATLLIGMGLIGIDMFTRAAPEPAPP